MKRITIDKSSFAKSCGFEPVQGQLTGVLEVEKLNGQVLRFSNVTMEQYVDLMRAESFGKAIQPVLRGKNDDGTVKYPCMVIPVTVHPDQRDGSVQQAKEDAANDAH